MKVLSMARSPEPGQLQGRHVLAIFAGFFAAVFAVNGYFLYSALSTHTGIVANEPYRKGLAYNSRIEAERRQSELNWADNITIAAGGTVAVTMSAAEGRKVAGVRLSGVLSRPATAGFDRPLRFTEVEPGLYTADAGGIESGSWLVAIEARMSSADKEPVYRARRRLWLKP